MLSPFPPSIALGGVTVYYEIFLGEEQEYLPSAQEPRQEEARKNIHVQQVLRGAIVNRTCGIHENLNI